LYLSNVSDEREDVNPTAQTQTQTPTASLRENTASRHRLPVPTLTRLFPLSRCKHKLAIYHRLLFSSHTTYNSSPSSFSVHVDLGGTCYNRYFHEISSSIDLTNDSSISATTTTHGPGEKGIAAGLNFNIELESIIWTCNEHPTKL
jgi:hypothetical protein